MEKGWLEADRRDEAGGSTLELQSVNSSFGNKYRSILLLSSLCQYLTAREQEKDKKTSDNDQQV